MFAQKLASNQLNLPHVTAYYTIRVTSLIINYLVVNYLKC